MSAYAVTSSTGSARVFLAGAPQGFEAGHAGHAHVGDHHVEPAGRSVSSARSPESTVTVSKPWLLEKRLQQAALAGIVIDDENLRASGAVFFGFSGHAVLQWE